MSSSGCADDRDEGAHLRRCRPAGATIFRMTPLVYASISTVALSVSTSASAWPVSTGSPSFFSHRRMRPSSIVSLSFGITTREAIR